MPQYALFGNPVNHSISPQLHALFATQFNTILDYQKILTPFNAFEKTVDDFRKQGGLGANISMPFKITAFHYADQLTDRAKKAGAVNTFILKNNICVGDNTDGIGFIRDIKKNISLENKNIVIIGAGGSVRGILSDIIREKPKKIVIHNRSIENAKTLIDYFKNDFEIEFFLHLKSEQATIDLLINATTINFQKDFNTTFHLSNTFCYDLNYGERAHSFLQWAKSQGSKKGSDGLGMLIEQGAESFFQWFGQMPETHSVGGFENIKPSP